MGTKAAKPKASQRRPRYASEDLAPRNAVADEAKLDTYLKRNKDGLNASIEKAHTEFERGEYFTMDQVMADMRAQQQRRSRKA
ncbi:MAG: hypothetical protein ACREHE_09640 [Rhizomicrobium sp.]